MGIGLIRGMSLAALVAATATGIGGCAWPWSPEAKQEEQFQARYVIMDMVLMDYRVKAIDRDSVPLEGYVLVVRYSGKNILPTVQADEVRAMEEIAMAAREYNARVFALPVDDPRAEPFKEDHWCKTPQKEDHVCNKCKGPGHDYLEVDVYLKGRHHSSWHYFGKHGVTPKDLPGLETTLSNEGLKQLLQGKEPDVPTPPEGIFMFNDPRNGLPVPVYFFPKSDKSVA